MMLGLEKSCRRKTKGVAWSMKLVAAGRKVRYWRMRLSNQINRRDPSLRLVHLGKTLEVPWQHLQTDDLASKITLA
eukprot:4603078-Ditylum_brightwellii.AAC.1